MKTYSAKPSDITRTWYILDASEAPMGRIATRAATLLLGKGKPMFTHHIDVGDYVIIINAEKLVVSGNKLEDKKYYSHSGYPGGLTERTLRETMSRTPERALEHAIRGMLPVNKLRPARLARLKVYVDESHNHDAQKPVKLSMKVGK